MFANPLLCTLVILLAAAPADQPMASPTAQPEATQRASDAAPQSVEPQSDPIPETKSKTTDAAEPETKAESVEDDLLAIEKNIIDFTNAQRAKHGLAALRIDPDLMESARQHASWMASNRRLVHTSRPVAENIAMGQRDSRSAVAAWMNSSGHRANILNRGYRTIGVAAYRTPQGTIYWCQQFRR